MVAVMVALSGDDGVLPSAENRTAHAELRGQLTLRHEPVADAELSVQQLIAQEREHLGEAARSPAEALTMRRGGVSFARLWLYQRFD